MKAVAGGGFLLLVLSACSLPGTGPDPEETMGDLATALSAGDVAKIDFTGDDAAAAKAYKTVTAGLGRPEVSAGEVTEGTGDGDESDTATGTLKWRWKVGAKTWSYDTEVALARAETDDGKAWLVRWSPRIVEPSLEANEVLDQTSVKPQRGNILGAGDKPVVAPRPVLRVGIDKTRISPAQAERSAETLAGLVDIAAPPYLKQVAAAGPKAFVQAIVYRREQAPRGMLLGLEDIPGARAISDRLPLAPTKDFASALLGSVGSATAELVEDSDGRIKAGDEVGISGLQLRYDEQLFGTRGTTVAAVAPQGVRRTLFTAPPVAGQPLRTTLDLSAQRAAQDALAGVGPASALVAIRPSTGELVAVASGPGSKGYSTATVGQYAPGSTFKIVTALALLRSGLTPTSQVDCPATTVVDGKTFKNYDDYPSSALGRITLAEAFANSCNTAFIGQRDQVDDDELAQAAAALGLGADQDTGFPSFFGKVGRAGSETQAAASLIGQGSVLASPMAMAAVTASVVKGSAVVPTLLPEHEADEKEPAQPLTAAEADQLQSLMAGVVERGSGALLKGLPGGRVIAKTGTAEFGEKPPLPTHAWMVAGRDDLAVAVFVERGESGSGSAGPVLRQFLARVR